MSSIQSINGFGPPPVQGAAKAPSAGDQFSQILDNLKTYGASAANENSSGGGEDETVTKLRNMPDGSLVMQVIRGNKIISQTKIAQSQGATGQPVPEVQPDGSVKLVDRFNDSSASLTAGALFSGLV